jgi:glycosyltransferase involved in cell wall biosynthesis
MNLIGGMTERDDIALVCHPLHQWGGGEYHLKVLCDVFQRASILTAWYDPSFIGTHFPGRRIVSSHLQKLPIKKPLAQELIPLLPTAYRSMNLLDFKFAIILSDGFEKNVRAGPCTRVWMHVLTPTRFLWMENRATKFSKKLTFKLYKYLFEKPLHTRWRRIDRNAALRADFVTSNSQDVKERVRQFYGIDSTVLYPPVELKEARFNPDWQSRKKWYLYLGKVEAYKGVELAIRTCARTGRLLKIAGHGSDVNRLKQLTGALKASDLVQFLGFVDKQKKWELYNKCRAVLYPVRDEDFGIVPVEANAAGAPVIAYRGGGVKETIVDQKTGVFFKDFTVYALFAAMEQLDRTVIHPQDCAVQAKKFSRELFEESVRKRTENILSESGSHLLSRDCR